MAKELNLALVDKTLQGTRIITRRGAEYGDNLHVVEVVPREFSSLCGFYPILIAHTDAAGGHRFVSILGFEPGENLYLQGNDWDAGYIPLTIRRQPFQVIAQEITEEDGSKSQVPTMAINLDSPRISREQGEDIIGEDGELTPWFKEVTGMVSAMVEGTNQARELLRQLDSLGLIEPLQVGFKLVDGVTRRLDGLYTINEARLRELPDDAVLELHRRGYLDCIYSMRASLGHLGGLARRKDARLQATTG